ncbi:MAG: enoyl-CoA hydratase/isomerase family protein [Acidimicrobiia bacterium]|nr:enoyl-CoA hydratase/isomerase family protein [Acidimicrobiia bacterium]MDH5237207.1 enoyl-CoA hydratase/isomerase family protein [Acidimicrobiia bacterium]
MSEPVIPDLGSEHLVVHVDRGVLHVRVDRTERRNAFTQDMYRGLKRAAIWADRTGEIDAMCLTGTAEWFGAGGDMGGHAADRETLAAEWDPTDHFPFRHFERCRKPIVTKINGVCQAGGLNLVMYSDVSVASDRATFRVPELLRGAPDPWMAARLAEHVGPAKAKYLYFTAARFDAAEAEAMGLVAKVVPHAELDQHVDWVLEQIRLTGPQSRALIKADINDRLPEPDAKLFASTILSPEMREGMAAFIEKRPPAWPR